MSLSKQHRQESVNKVCGRQRVYDHLYDPVHTVSSEADHARCNFRAHASVDRLRRVPRFGCMFSSLPHHPPCTLRLSAVDPVPPTIDRRWRGPHTDAQRSRTLQQLAGVLPGSGSEFREQECDVNAADRWKFFNRPHILYTHHLPPDVVFAPLVLSGSLHEPGGVEDKKPAGVYHRTVAVQTDYRDGEAQTDPYSPEYVVRPGTAQPELLALASLTWGRGLPAGLAEVEMIQRARAKRAWEASLPPLDDLAQLDKRRRMMQAMECQEWAFREGEIQKLQEARLAVLKDLLSQQDRAQDQTTARRVDQDFTRHQRDKEKRLLKINHDYMRSLRKLTAQRHHVEGKFERRDVVQDHTNHASETYAPLARHGHAAAGNRSGRVVKSRFLNTYTGLLELEVSLPTTVLEPRIKAPKPRDTGRFVSRRERRDMELIKTHEALKEEKEGKGHVEPSKPLRFLVKKEKPPPGRPATPRVDPPPEGEEERELAIINLQRLLRGRSIQSQMCAGKERSVELIWELRTTHALLQEDQELLRAQTDLLLREKNQRDRQRHQAAEEQAHLAGVAGAELVELLDVLSKELIRLQEERRIHAMALLAERERRRREAEESGRRQVEERRRREEEEIFRQVVQVHQATVDLYLEDVILASMEQTADQQAREEVRRMAREVNDIAYAMEESLTELQSEEIVSELVHSFLLPEVQKISVRRKVRDRQRRHLQAAQRILHGSAGGPGASLEPAGLQSPGSGSAGLTPVGLTEDRSRQASDSDGNYNDNL